MQPTDDADQHLTERAIEIRTAMGAAVLAVLTIAAIFYPLEIVFSLFAIGYIVYKYRYYSKRVGVFTSPERTTDIDRLELALGVFVASIVAMFVAIETFFDDAWDLGGFLSLPPVEFTDTDFLMDNLDMVIAWAIVIAPIAALSYLTLQVRHRNLLGLTDDRAVMRATAWDAFVRLPMYLLWMVVLTLGPIFDVWNDIPAEIQETLDLEPELVMEFSLLLGDQLEETLLVGLVVPAIAVGSFLLVQRGKYENETTIPELFGYRGAFAPGPESHTLNAAVPIGVAALVTMGVFLGLESVPIGETVVIAGVAVAILVGANIFGYTSMAVESAHDTFASEVDAVVFGLGAGFVIVVIASLATGLGTASAAAAYLAVAPGVTFVVNYASARQRESSFAEYTTAVRENPQAADDGTIDELFAAARDRDLSLRATALDGLAVSFTATDYRNDETLAVFTESLTLDDPYTVQAALAGIATVLSIDRSAEGINPEISTWVDNHLKSKDAQTRARAAQASALIETRKLDLTAGLNTENIPRDRIERLEEITREWTNDPGLVGAVAEYAATLWYLLARTEPPERLANHATAQRLLGDSIWMTPYANEYAQLAVVYAVTGKPPVADDTRFELAVDHLDNEHDAVRYLSTIVVRSSLQEHSHEVAAEDLASLLEDEYTGVRREGARTLATYVEHDPDAVASIADDLILFLEEATGRVDIAEKHALDALSGIDSPILGEHPTAATTIASYVAEQTAFVAIPAAKGLARLVAADPSLVENEAVATAIESGLTHPHEAVRGHCIEAAAAVIEADPTAAHPFRYGLAWNLREEGPQSTVAVAALSTLLAEEPADGLDLLSDLAAGLQNPTRIDHQAIPFMIRGETVSDAVVDILTDVVPEDPEVCGELVDPLISVSSSADAGTLYGLMAVMNELSKAHPERLGKGTTVASTALRSGRTETRRNAAQFMANVAAYRPETVEPFLDELILVTDDESPRVRSPALAALANVCAAMPLALEDDIHRVVGLIDDDSAIVRKRAGHLIVTIADREPSIVEPAAETADRLRRLQRDPAVDYDSQKLQDASAAIQTDGEIGEADTVTGDAESLYTPESSDEMGASGDTEIFQPVGDDFDADFEDEFDDEEFDEPEETSDVAAQATAVKGDDLDDQETVIEGEDADLDDQETVIEGEDADFGDQETVIEGEDADFGDQETVIEDEDADFGDQETVIEGEDADFGDQETVIEDEDADFGDQETVIEDEDADFGDQETVIEGEDDDSEGIAETAIEGGDEDTEDETDEEN